MYQSLHSQTYHPPGRSHPSNSLLGALFFLTKDNTGFMRLVKILGVVDKMNIWKAKIFILNSCKLKH